MSKVLWTQRANFGPSARYQSAIAFDSNRNRTVLFGGGTLQSPLGDTWEWDGSFWTQVSDSGPAARGASAMVFDSNREVCVLFGGKSDVTLGDTWQWDGSNWTEIANAGPSTRTGHAMAFDSIRNRVVLFGGQAAENARFNDTWEFDGAAWAQVADTGPEPRSFHGMGFESANSRCIMFGGLNAAVATVMLGDTWAWDSQAWTKIQGFGPSGRFDPAMASTGTQTFVYGGLTSRVNTQVPQQDTWRLDGSLWTQVQEFGPGPLHASSLAFDSNRSQLVLFGGEQLPVSLQVNAGALPFSGLTWEAPSAPPAAAPA
jgi:N-acetylneuraminic acid mutarotase